MKGKFNKFTFISNEELIRLRQQAQELTVWRDRYKHLKNNIVGYIDSIESSQKKGRKPDIIFILNYLNNNY